MSKVGDPADKTAVDQFQPVVNRRAGYGTQQEKLERIIKVARQGGTLYAGEGQLVIDYYESEIRKLLESHSWVHIRSELNRLANHADPSPVSTPAPDCCSDL